MIHRTPSGQVIGSTKPTARTVVTYQPPTQIENYTLESLPGFPQTLFTFKKYDGARLLTAFLLVLATVYFLSGFAGFVLDHTPWLHDLLFKNAAIAPAPAPWWQVWKTIGKGVAQVTSYVDLAFRLFVFLCAYCLAWATFDPRNIEGYVMGFFNVCLGAFYMISPMDVIPDVLPIAGSIDDVVLGLGMMLLGVSSWYRNKLRDVRTKTVLELIDHGNSSKAMRILLEDKGIAVKDSSHL